MAILFGTTGDGTTLPVLVDQFGNLLAKGITGDEGPPGPPGAPGGDFALPPNPVDGDVLGWENGALVWVSEPPPPPILSTMKPVIYSGNGGIQSIDCGFSPSLVWIKSRTNATSHFLFDVVRGASQELFSDLTNAQIFDNNGLTSFDSNGFSLESNGSVNGSGRDFVAWCFDAGDTTVTNNEGDIESQVRSNGTTSIVSFSTSAQGIISIGHGLSKVPSLVITKQTNGASSWITYHSEVTSFDQQLRLNSSSALISSPQCWGSASNWNEYTFGLNTTTTQNGNIIAYCISEQEGVTSFGSYTGNGNVIGPQIDCGFEPLFVLIKRTDVANNWVILDSARNPTDPVNSALYADLANSQSIINRLNFVPSGFEIISTLGEINAAGGTYSYVTLS